MSLARRFAVFVVSRVLPAALACGLLVSIAPAEWTLHAQGQQTLLPGRNVNMVSGTSWPNGDPYLQRQNEPSVAASTRNPLHLLAGANDYRTVDIPFVAGVGETGDAWLGIFKSFDGGQRWQTNLLPGYPQDLSPEGLASPLKGYQAGADPVVRPGTSGLLYYAGIVFDRVENGRSAVFVSRFIDNNNKENGDPIAYLGTSIVATDAGGAGGAFIDKPWMAVDVPRAGARLCVIPLPGSSATQQVRAGNIYVAYALISGAGATFRSTIMFTTSADCGARWSRPVAISSPSDPVNQGATIAINPRTGAVNVAWRVFGMNGAADAMMVAQASGPGRPFQRFNKARRFLADHSDDDVEKWLTRKKHKRQHTGHDNDRRVVAERGRDDDRGRGRDDDDDWRREESENRSRREWNRRKSRATLAEAAGEAVPFDQATQGINDPNALAFRTNSYPTMTFDGNGRAYLAWTERGYAGAQAGDARVVISTSIDGVNWTPRQVVEDPNVSGVPVPGHQLMPSITFGGGRVMLLYYDLREDVSEYFGEFIDDKSAAIGGSGKRHTLDLRASFGTPGATPVFEPSIRVSEYLSVMKRDPGTKSLYGVQAQFNAPNLPMFKQGTAPFMGDYVDVALAPAFVPTANGGWAYNTNGAQPVFHAVWTDNRDVRQPAAGADGKPDWTKYTPPLATQDGSSRFDPTQPRPVCDPSDPSSGSRNQNIYTARLTAGLLVGSPGNAKPLSTSLQRAFVVFAQNTGSVTKVFRMTIGGQPAGGRASFTQFGTAVTSIDVTTPPRSMASRSVYVTSSNPDAQIRVNVEEAGSIGGAVITGGLSDVIVLNPDIANPDIANPDIANPDIANPDIANPDIANKEIYNPDIANPDIANPDIANPDIANPDIANPDIANPDIANPDIANPDIANPDIANPDIANPDIANVQVANPDIANPDIANPDIANPDIANPDIANPDIANPDIANPDIANPDIANASLTDVTWTMTNNGNTTAAFNVNLFLAQQTSRICAADPSASEDDCITTQLILRKVYNTPITGGTQSGVANGCAVQVQSQNILLANIANPRFVTPGQSLPDQNDPSAENATVWLAPGETAKITLRVYDPHKYNNIAPTDSQTETSTDPDGYLIDPIFLPTTTTEFGSVTPVVQQQSVDTADIVAAGGPNSPVPPVPPVVTPLSDGVPPVQTPTATLLAFVAQPTDVEAGAPMSPVSVTVRDQYGALLHGAVVTLHLASNPANAVLSGAIATSVGGTATFSALTVGSAGVGFALAATAGTALPAVSNAFNVTAACNPLVVTTTADTGVCGSLRFAIDTANTSAGTITFEIAESLPHVIAPSTPLPAIIANGVVIDGTTDPHYLLSGGQPVIQISGAGLPDGSVGLALTGTGSTVKGIEFNAFTAGASGPYTAAGVLLAGGGGHTVQSSHFGMIVPNYTGIHVLSPWNVIGGTAVGAGNTVGGSGQQQGIWIQGGSNNRIEGNFVGNNGVSAFGNGVGIRITGAASTVIGGAAPGARNVISGNTVGVLLVGGSATEIRGNYVGLNAAGTGAIPNSEGVTAYDLVQNTVIQGNWIAGNSQRGIDLQRSGALPAVSGTQILSNTIGLNILGNTLANGAGGVRLTGTEGTILGAPGAGNTVSGNGGSGIAVVGVSGSGPVIRGNRIGTDPTGLAARQNLNGISVENATGVVIGGAGPGEGNLISANQNNGVLVGGTSVGTLIQGNKIGTDLNGNVSGLGNGVASVGCCYSGVALIGQATGTILGGAAPGAGNLVAGNPTGIWTGSGSATIRGNTVERNTAGAGAIWVQDTAQLVVAGNTIRLNDGIGVGFNGATGGVVVGGPGAGDANVITGNGGTGVNVGSGSSQVRIQSNQIFSNNGLGIDLVASGFWGDGPTANDAGDGDSGTNGLQNFPVLSNPSATSVTFALDAPVGTYTLDFFANPTCDPSGYGEGQMLLGTSVGGTSGVVNLAAAAPSGWFITATATDDALGNTSEFSSCVQVPVATQAATVTLSGLSAIYDGTPKSVGYTTNPLGLNVTVTYDGSSAPSDIGAYFVQATVASPGYSGSATANFKIASTLAAGGGGGGPYERYCGAGVFANGFGVSPPNDSLWSAQLRCSDGNHPVKFGNTDTPPFDTPNTLITCSPGEIMVGARVIHGEVWGGGDMVIAMAPRCQLPSGGTISEPFAPAPGTPSGFSQTDVLDCPAGQAVTGVVGGAGSIVDSIALVCAAIPSAGPAITSASPSTVAAFQYITLEGTSLPAVSWADVLFSQGGPEFASDYVWSAGSTRVIARVPTGVLAVGAATVRLKNPAGTVTTNAVPITIDSVPGAPVMHAVYNSCFGGTATTTLNQGQQFMIEAAGTGSAGTEFSWTNGVSTVPGTSAYSTAGPTGRLGTCANLPGGVTSGSWTLSIRSYTGAWSSPIPITIVP